MTHPMLATAHYNMCKLCMQQQQQHSCSNANMQTLWHPGHGSLCPHQQSSIATPVFKAEQILAPPQPRRELGYTAQITVIVTFENCYQTTKRTNNSCTYTKCWITNCRRSCAILLIVKHFSELTFTCLT